MRCIIAGSRSITEYKVLAQVMEKYNFLDITEVVSGTARGVDTLGEQWATQHHIKVKKMPARWDLYGLSAGPRRNKEMAQYTDIAVVIWDGQSAGAEDMISQMRKIKKICYVELAEPTKTETVFNYKGI